VKKTDLASGSEKARRYHRFKDAAFFISLSVNLAFLVYFFFSGASAEGQHFFMHMFFHMEIRSFPFLVFCVSTLFFVCLICVNIWFSLFEGFFLERDFGFSKQSFWQWLADYLKSTVISYIIFEILIVLFYVFLRDAGSLWWVYIGAVWFVLSVLLARITPTVIIPLFYKYSMLAEGELLNVLRAYLDRIKSGIGKIYTVDFSRKTTKANAFICGLGASKRLVLTDTLVNDYASQEVLNVVAHEFAHIKHHDVLRQIIVSLICTFSGLYGLSLLVSSVAARYDIAVAMPYTLPLFGLVFMIFSFLVNPLQNACMRYFEKQADMFALQTVQDTDAFISMMTKLKEKNLAEEHPPLWKEWLFYTHPPIYRRIEYARAYEHATEPR